jgi:hypothetical protein
MSYIEEENKNILDEEVEFSVTDDGQLINDYYQDDDNVSDVQTNRRYNKSKKNVYDLFNELDKGFISYSKISNGNKYKINMYSNGVNIGNKIRDAITGNYYNCNIGSYHENFFFKVRMTTIANKSNVTLYYLSIRDYETHQKVVVTDTIKKKWLLRKREIEDEMEKQNNQQKSSSIIVK